MRAATSSFRALKLDAGHAGIKCAAASSSRRLLHASPSRLADGLPPSSKEASTSSSASSSSKAPSPAPPRSDAGPLSEGGDEPPPSFTTSLSQVYAEKDRKPLPLLARPLGVAQAPSSKKRTWAERREMALDYDRRMEKRKIIVQQATRGYFHDFHAMQSHGGKTWRAPATLIRQDRARFFPDVQGTRLSDKASVHTTDMLQGRVSLVSIMGSQVSEQHAKSFAEALLPLYYPGLAGSAGNSSSSSSRKTSGHFQWVQINLQENSLKAYLVGLFLSSLRKSIPEALQSTYLLSNQNMEMERPDLGLSNKHVGYSFLVGPDVKIRWAGCAFAEREERDALVACAGVLINRLKEEQHGGTRKR
ncbi:hypothetical protein FA10DRAFT_266014 [Acaromyces ingoldii]|uniref:Uncharacterized protein n=1 Tax=Acaromyces ingoldii TaxID=215250 RepID=A0A316YT54_9BASI|nr:hypothetical protein FA10DRAFT_266014 [Acaromyces ingoldii]PWN92216.1 hypothetical protein FA10DRAFT_266014 [Acaromyces ingoldii]